MRSRVAAEQLRARGMQHVHSLTGGVKALDQLGRQAAE
jgi:hypothetical protein